MLDWLRISYGGHTVLGLLMTDRETGTTYRVDAEPAYGTAGTLSNYALTPVGVPAYARAVETVAALRALPPSVPQLSVSILGYYAPNDGGGGPYRWDGASTAADDGALTIKPDSIPAEQPGRWLMVHDGTINVLRCGAQGNGELYAATGRDNSSAFDAAYAPKLPVYVPAGIYRITRPSLMQRSVRGSSRDTAIILCSDSTQPVLNINGGRLHIADLTIRHMALPTTRVNIWDGCGIRIVGRVDDGTVIERVHFVNHTSGICMGDPMAPYTSTVFYSNTVRDCRIERFSFYAIEIDGPGQWNTGCLLQNIYCVNWNDYAAGTKLTAKAAIRLVNSNEWEIDQLNIEHGVYERGIDCVNIEQLAVNGLHIEGYVAKGNFNGIVCFDGASYNHTIGNMSIVFSRFDVANSNDYSIFRLNGDTRLIVENLHTRDNTRVGGINCRRVYGAGGLSTIAGVRFFQWRDNDGVFSSGDFSPRTYPPITWQLNEDMYRWRENGRERFFAVAAPTTGTWVAGDMALNNAITEQGTAGSRYIVRGWRCVTGGAPGTWVTERASTGN
ncbi:hypothetical protein IHN63_15485 [Deinococcus sp. 6YEL10]|uniref:hypothetical protein n=1 Tax=Deinococcus sp. 6YEL10 TaxID=2745870 RepID=UPI001E3AC008|nr:hypothetical protein [Deinococcus sp. 6YEL10]MCD0162691.1 hypothetical protein [Deinococcus sp. 6YEL10]